MVQFSLLWKAPEVNPITKKARSIPFLNPFSNTHGRTFFFSWFGFMIAFWSWDCADLGTAFPPLLYDVIAGDIGMKPAEVANSNIIALTATLIVRLIAGPCCDHFGPRLTFAGCLLAGAIPTFLAGCVHNTVGLYGLRFFIGILGGSFVPCQVWTTGFFDKNVIGTANALTGGLGNLGGGITYFVMPAVYNSLVSDGLSKSKAWRVSFVVPGILIVFVALCLIFLCDDTPTGEWADRFAAAEEELRRHSVTNVVTDASTGGILDAPPTSSPSEKDQASDSEEKPHGWKDNEAHATDQAMLDTARGEVVQKPSLAHIAHVMFSPQTIVTAACYFCTFGGELAINSILGNYYSKNFPALDLQASGNWAAMFGLLNGVTRPLGGYLSDLAYRRTHHRVWAKKAVLHAYGLLTGVFLIAIGALDPRDQATMFGLVAAMAVFLEGGNGANFGLVPHVHPAANGVVSGFTGAAGNLGGIVFAVIFRYHGRDYARVFWIVGVVTIGINAAVGWIRPIPRGQAGGK
ncbi:nitrate transporter [Massariosphaeria phaeospora]|uniref:Nitrate/nitrite transporter n=1 Tax=Massariosphaeria phaeospora TaxID=100035 RepID=A0A7C8ME18_9PLEO|nr:nitrate transporter [Massariosphaeria phaeospora]